MPTGKDTATTRDLSPLRALRRVPRWWRHLFQGLVVGTAITTITIFVYLVALGRWPWGWGYTQCPDGTPDPASVLATQFAFGQVFLGFVAIFLAGFLGFFAIREFAEGQERANLRLAFHPYDKGILSAPNDVEKSGQWRFHVALYNDGPVTAVWYMIELRFDLPEGWQCEAVIGEYKQHWVVYANERGQPVGFTFLSNGTYAAYPNYPLVLWQFTAPAKHLGGLGRLVIQCHVYSERTSPWQGKLLLLLPMNTPTSTAEEN